MRLPVLLIALGQLMLPALSLAEDRHQEVVVEDPYIELHSGPGRGYPIFYVAERGEEIEIVRRRTDWFQVIVPRGEEGWVHLEQLQRTLNVDGSEFDIPGFGIGDFAHDFSDGLPEKIGKPRCDHNHKHCRFSKNTTGQCWFSLCYTIHRAISGSKD